MTLAVSAAAWAALGTWATVLVYGVLLVFAIVQVLQARKLRTEQLRPYVVAELVPGFLITFRVKNYGQTMARDVTLEWDPWPETTFDDDPIWQSPDKSALFSTGIPFLPPGQELTTLFDHFPNRASKGLRMRERVTVTYHGADKKPYVETYDLDLELLKGLRRIGRKEMHDAAKALETIAQKLDRGVRVETSSRDRSSRREIRGVLLTQARRTYRADGTRAAARYVLNETLQRSGWHFWD